MPTPQARLLAIADISADPHGSVEFTRVCTKIDRPFLVYNPVDATEAYEYESPFIDRLCSFAWHPSSTCPPIEPVQWQALPLLARFHPC